MEITQKELDQFKDLELNRIITIDDAFSAYDKYVSESNLKIQLGFQTLDKHLTGIRAGEVLTVLAPTNVGKTAFVLNTFRNQLLYDSFIKEKILINFSLELTDVDIFERITQMEMDMCGYSLERKWNEKGFKEEVYVKLKKLDNIVSVIGIVHINEIMPYVRAIEYKTGKKCGMIAIDYAGLVQANGRSAYEITSNAVTGIKAVAMTTNVPVLLTSQVDRASSRDKIDLYSGKESGSIENVSQIVLSLTRPKESIEYQAFLASLPEFIKEKLTQKKMQILTIEMLKKKRGTWLDSNLFLLFDNSSLRMSEYSNYVSEVIF